MVLNRQSFLGSFRSMSRQAPSLPLPAPTPAPITTKKVATPVAPPVVATVSISPKPSVEELNKGIYQAKLDYVAAQAKGDQKAMQAAAQKAENLRSMGGTIASSATLEQSRNALSATAPQPARYAVAHGINDSQSTITVPAAPTKLLTAKIAVSADGTQEALVYNNGTTLYKESTQGGAMKTTSIEFRDPLAEARNRQLRNQQVEEAKIRYLNAVMSGDQTARAQAEADANQARALGATIGVHEDTPATLALKNYYASHQQVKASLESKDVHALNQAILQAKNDYQWALAHNDQAGMKVAQAVGENLRKQGGTIGAHLTLEQAKQQLNPPAPVVTTPKSNDTILGFDKQTISSTLDATFLVGSVKSVIELITGQDLITSTPLTTEDKILTGASILPIPGLKGAGKVGQAVLKVSADSIRKVGDDILDVSEQAGGHLIAKHVSMTNEELIKRANQTGLDVSTFPNKSTATQVVKENIRNNADEISEFLSQAKEGAVRTFLYTHPYPIGKGTQESTKVVNYDLNTSKVVIVKQETAKYGYYIKTAFPLVD